MDEERKNTDHRRRNIAFMVFFIVILIGAIIGYLYVQYKKTHISTNDAFVEGSVHTISSRIPGTVIKVNVSDNEFVKKGTLLLELDPEIYEIKLKEAIAGAEAEKKKLNEIKAGIEAQRKKVEFAEAMLEHSKAILTSLKKTLIAREAEVEAKEAMLRQAESDFRRIKSLFEKGVVPRDRYEKAETAYDTAKSALRAAKAIKAQTEAQIKAQEALVKQAQAGYKAEKAVLKRLIESLDTQSRAVKRREANVEQARLNLSYTKIYAPSDGYITRKSVEVGNTIQAGQPLMALVPLNDVYIVANYKETKIHRIRPGMKVKIKVDAYPDHEFIGRVESIMAGTGARFSLFPPENATGNYVKVVQRIPVKIVLETTPDPDHPLRIGMSVVPTVIATR
jgi:membrane fusion protein (multidrug efflux system)